MNVLMVLQNLNFKDFYNYPMGYFYLAAAIKRAGHNIEWLEFTEKRPTVDEIAAAIKEIAEKTDIKVVMCGTLFAGWREFEDIMIGVKKADESLITVGGGGGLTYSSNEIMKFVPALDIGALGEGEIVITQLLDALENNRDLADVRGIVYRDSKGVVVRNAAGDYVRDLDTLHYPLFSPTFERIIHQTKRLLVAGSRSCPFNCTFCCCVTTKIYRKRKIDEIIREIAYYKEKYDVRSIYFIDELLSEDPDRIYELCDKLAALNVEFIFQMRASKNYSVELFKSLVHAGMKSFAFGVENTNDEILDSMNKRTGTALLNYCFDVLEESGINQLTEFNLLIGDPAETLETFANTIRFLRENYKKYKVVSPILIKCYPGSQIYIDAVKRGIIDPDQFFLSCGYAVPLFNITHLSDSIFEAMKMTAFYERSVNRHNENLEVEIYNIDGKYFIKWRCACCDESVWRSKPLGNWLEYTVGTEITFLCPFCDRIVVDIVKNKYYDLLGEKLAEILPKKRVLFYGVNEILRKLLDYILDYDFIVTAPDLGFSAEDWYVIENELYDKKVMSYMLNHKFTSNLSREDLDDIDIAIVVSNDLFNRAKAEIACLNENTEVVMYSDLL